MRNIIVFLIFGTLIGQGGANASLVTDYFQDFYCSYTKYVPNYKRETLDFLYALSKEKLNAFEKDYNENKDTESFFCLVEEEYLDLKENLDFELSIMNCKCQTRREERQIKKAHKKFMRLLKNCCS